MDEIERRIRAARPLSGSRDLPLTGRAKSELAELLLGTPVGPEDRYREIAAAATAELQRRAALAHESEVVPRLESVAGEGQASVRPAPTASRGRRWGRVRRGGIVSIVAAMFAALAGLLFSVASAAALTPPLLTFTPIDAPREQVIAELAAAARAQEPPDPDEPQVIETIGWWLRLSGREDGTLEADKTVIWPEERLETIHPDGSRELTVIAGERWDRYRVRPADSPAPGTVLQEEAWGPGEYEPVFPEPKFSDAEGFRALLTEVGPASVDDPYLSFYEVQTLISEWHLTGDQIGEVVEFLGSFPEVDVAGTTTDRLDRDAIALVALNSDGSRSESLLFDPETGRLLAAESVQLTDDLAGVDAPAVTSYTLWK